MKDIYSQADLVLGWLGPSGEYGEFVLEKIERVGLHMRRIAFATRSAEDDVKFIKKMNEEVKTFPRVRQITTAISPSILWLISSTEHPGGAFGLCKKSTLQSVLF